MEKKLIAYSCAHTCPNTQSWESTSDLEGGISYEVWGQSAIVFTAQTLLRARQKRRQGWWTMQGAHMLHRTATSSAQTERQAGQGRPLQWCLGGGDDITLGA